MASLSFKPDRKGLIDLRNEGFVQRACLDRAKQVGSAMTTATSVPVSTDVQPGKRRCHARASISMNAPAFKDVYQGINKAIRAVAGVVHSFGGQVTYDFFGPQKRRKKGKR